MDTQAIVTYLDREIETLQHARGILTGLKQRPKRVISTAGRQRIVDAQRKRWAERKAA